MEQFKSTTLQDYEHHQYCSSVIITDGSQLNETQGSFLKFNNKLMVQPNAMYNTVSMSWTQWHRADDGVWKRVTRPIKTHR
jgi:hypothetical protein